ncbi:unnamed protein product [Polarella glacialis]|uniref:EF-hand domain-containing protein n=1 Tax=Polarella glacialis TaxID=89957 RepID=A0A813INH1_POLGL|nr:unnamed protein product [Polarella glacialis]
MGGSSEDTAETVALTKQIVVEAFRNLDQRGSGVVDTQAFAHLMCALFSWSLQQAETILDASGSEEAGGQVVRYDAFASWLFAPGREGLRSAGGGRQSGDALPSGLGSPVITAEQLLLALENMIRAWDALPYERRLSTREDCGPSSRSHSARSFFDDGCEVMCQEMVQRWHGGKSSHPDRDSLAAMYGNTGDGWKKLLQDVCTLREVPPVKDADFRYQRAKFAYRG